MIPLYLVAGLFNIWAQRSNYHIQLENGTEMDIRVRRSVPESLLETDKRLKRTPNYFTDWFYKSGVTYNLDEGLVNNSNDATAQHNNEISVAQNSYLSQYNDVTNNGYLQNGSKNNYNYYPGNNNSIPRYNYNRNFSNNGTYYSKYPIGYNITNYNNLPRYNYTARLNNVTKNGSYNIYNNSVKGNPGVYNNYNGNYANGYGYNGYGYNISGYGYNPFNVNGTATTTTTERIVTGCIICNISCPKFLKRIGGLCLPDDDDY